MTSRDLAELLDLAALAAEIPCRYGVAECTCDACVAVAAILLADEHLEAGRLLDAAMKAQHAAHFYPTFDTLQAAARLERELLALPVEQRS